MIPHAPLALAGAVGALLVAVIGPPLVAVPVFLPRLAGRPRPTPVAAHLAAVDVPAVAPSVYPERLVAVPAMS
jgi:hypothetical protein